MHRCTLMHTDETEASSYRYGAAWKYRRSRSVVVGKYAADLLVEWNVVIIPETVKSLQRRWAPVMVVCGAVAVWGFRRLVRMHGMLGWQFWRIYISLPEAASRLYGLTRGTAIATFAEGSSRNANDPPSDILNWYAYWTIQHDEPVYGVRPPSSLRERIKRSDAEGKYHFANGATQLTGGYPPRPVFAD